MKSTLATIILVIVLLVSCAPKVQANELQMFVFNAAGNLGVAAAIIELQGVTPENSETINTNINNAINWLTQLADGYNDPPFKSENIRRIIDNLIRFVPATDRSNNWAKVAYLETAYNDLKSAMTVIFRNNLEYYTTCDTFIADLGFHTGQATIAIETGNNSMLAAASSRINLAISGGTNIRESLGCSFPGLSELRALINLNSANPAQSSVNVQELSGRIRLASLNMDPGFTTPSSPNRQQVQQQDQDRNNNNTRNTRRRSDPIEGLWQWDVGGSVEIVPVPGERSKWNGIMRRPTRGMQGAGYRDGEIVYVLNKFSGGKRYEGTVLIKNREGSKWHGIVFDIHSNNRTADIIYKISNRFGGVNNENYKATKIRDP